MEKFEKFEKFATAIFALLLLISFLGLCLYLYSRNPAEIKKKAASVQQVACPACGHLISSRAVVCPQCGDEPSQEVFLIYGLAGFAFLLGVQILQLAMLSRKDRAYLYLLSILAAISLFMYALTKEIFPYSGFLILIGGYLLFMAMIHLCYLVLWKKTVASSPNNKGNTSR